MNKFLALTLSALFFLNTQAASRISEDEFFDAAKSGNLSTIQSYIGQGSDVNAKDTYAEDTALHYAATNGHIDIVEVLLENGAHINEKDHLGFTPLHFAAFWGHSDTAKKLIEWRADIKIKNHIDNTPFDTAISNQKLDTAKIILCEGLVYGQYNINEVKTLRTKARLDFNLSTEAPSLILRIQETLKQKKSTLTHLIQTLRASEDQNGGLKQFIKKLPQSMKYTFQQYQNEEALREKIDWQSDDARKIAKKSDFPSLQLLCAGFIAKKANFDK